LSKESKDLINHVLVPDPDLRFSLKHIKQHKWFREYFIPEKPIPLGLRVGIDRARIFKYLLKEMKDYFGMDDKLVRHCIEANSHNNLTACYHLLIKKKRLLGEDLNEYELY
jgi:hypothetical protein